MAFFSTRLRNFLLAAAVTSVGSIGGCSVEPETLDSFREIASSTSLASDLSGEDDDSLSSTLTSALAAVRSKGPTDSGDDVQIAKATRSYDPPFPSRTNPFRFPNDADEATSAEPATSVGDIEVLGFADVPLASGETQQRVLLKTAAGINSASVGDRIAGATLLRMNPPAVELQMGTLTWTATMFDR